MSKSRIISLASLVILVMLVAFIVFKATTSGGKFSAPIEESIIKKPNEWIIQLDLTNKEDTDTTYIINWSTAGQTYHNMSVEIKEGQHFTLAHHVYPETVKDGEVRLTIYKEGEATPVESTTYYIRFD